MNKTAIKNFAVWARNKLIADITYKAGLIGVSEKGIAQPLPQSSQDLQFFDIGTKDYAQVSGLEIIQREALVKAIQEKSRTLDHQTAFKTIVEEIAYTWFNRLIAIRFMEVNDYLPSRVRVLSSENPAKNEPDFVTSPFDTDLDFTPAEQDKVMEWKDQNKLDELFRMLFIKQCNKLHEILPELFEKTNDYSELLLNIAFTDKEGVVYRLVHDIPEDDFNVEKEGQVEIIGWLYQYYNTEPKDETFALLKKNVKITKERIPAATQLFTPDWIVRYMVENSLGRLWVEGHPNEELKAGWKYYLEEAEQEPEVQAKLEEIRAEYRTLNPEDIKVIDPCMGSGHLLVYCFDVLMQIYESQGYTQRDAAQSILEHNLYGLDIDNRAAQMAYFAVMMKARQYDRRIFSREIRPHVYAIQESNGIKRSHLQYFGADLSSLEQNNARNQMNGLLDTLVDAKEYGSILNVENYDWDLLRRFVDSMDEAGQMTLDAIGIDQTQQELSALVEIGQTMARKYHIVSTNPPYMGNGSMGVRLSQFAKHNYPDSKSDLFAVFIERCGRMTAKNCYQAMITQHAWMFLSSYEKLRSKMLLTDTVNMAHLGARAFEEIGGEVVQTTSFVLRNSHLDYKGVYCRLIEPTTQQGKEDMFLAGENRYAARQVFFSHIPGSPIAYWVSADFINIFKEKGLKDYAEPRHGMSTGNNDLCLRLWHEVDDNRICFDADSIEVFDASGCKYAPYKKGGEYRLWYGNNDYVIAYSPEARTIMQRLPGYRASSVSYFFRPSINWSDVSSSNFGVRISPKGFAFDGRGASMFCDDAVSYYLLGLMSSKIVSYILNVLNPTLTFNINNIEAIPVIISQKNRVEELVSDCVSNSMTDWDSFEISWDFKRHPLL